MVVIEPCLSAMAIMTKDRILMSDLLCFLLTGANFDLGSKCYVAAMRYETVRESDAEGEADGLLQPRCLLVHKLAVTDCGGGEASSTTAKYEKRRSDTHAYTRRDTHKPTHTQTHTHTATSSKQLSPSCRLEGR